MLPRLNHFIKFLSMNLTPTRIGKYSFTNSCIRQLSRLWCFWLEVFRFFRVGSIWVCFNNLSYHLTFYSTVALPPWLFLSWCKVAQPPTFQVKAAGNFHNTMKAYKCGFCTGVSCFKIICYEFFCICVQMDFSIKVFFSIQMWCHRRLGTLR